MVKRYPHTAIITIERGNAIVRGSYQEGRKETITIHGRYEVTDSRGEIRRKNALGDELKVVGEFYASCSKIENATHIVIKSLGVDASIICWEQLQSHSIISV